MRSEDEDVIPEERYEVWLGCMTAAEEAWKLLERGEWQPVLIAENVSDEGRGQVDYHRHVYWNETVSDDGTSVWAATLFAIPKWGHESGILAHSDNSYQSFVDANATKLFNGKPEEERSLWEIRADASVRSVTKYKIAVNGELKTFSQVDPDAALMVLFDGRLVATPVIYEIETSHRNLHQLIEHARLLFENWCDLAVFDGTVFYRRDSYGGPFAAYHVQIRRNLDDDPSTFRVEKFLSIGTAPLGVTDETIEAVLNELRKLRVTTVDGKPLDAKFHPKEAITDLNEPQRLALNEALKNRDADAPAAARSVLTFEVENTALFRRGPIRDNSGNLPINLCTRPSGPSTPKDECYRAVPMTVPDWAANWWAAGCPAAYSSW